MPTYTVQQQPFPAAVISTNSRRTAHRIAISFPGAVAIGHKADREIGSAQYNNGRRVDVSPPRAVSSLYMSRMRPVHGMCSLPELVFPGDERRMCWAVASHRAGR